MLPPNASPMHCRPIQTPKIGMVGPNSRTVCNDIPESCGSPKEQIWKYFVIFMYSMLRSFNSCDIQQDKLTRPWRNKYSSWVLPIIHEKAAWSSNWEFPFWIKSIYIKIKNCSERTIHTFLHPLWSVHHCDIPRSLIQAPPYTSSLNKKCQQRNIWLIAYVSLFFHSIVF